MTIDEAIAHAKEVAEVQRSNEQCNKCAKEHEQLAGWLEELKRYRELGTSEELQTMKERSFTAFELTLIAAGQMLLKEYRAIGTVEECKEAVKKLKEIER
ncbi:MAG: hypothetical protein EGR77_08230 [Pseudobutyrivibrio sp.]|nr:hypothetical protein [Pseudobutyrivibrio sp.]